MGTENKGKWVDVKERMPQKTGWYDVKTKYQIGPLNLPLSTTMDGKFVWVIPDESIITHWFDE